MDLRDIDSFQIDIKPEEPVFVIGVVSRMVRIPVWTLRKLDDMGVVCPQRIGKKTRCYSKKQVTKLSYVYHLMYEGGVNISSIKFILEKHEGGGDVGDI